MKIPTPREAQVIDLLAEGLSNEEIGARLGITKATVKICNYRLYRKFPEMGGRLGAVRRRAREHERQMALRLARWIQKHEGELSPDALGDIKAIMTDQVAPFLRQRLGQEYT